MLADQWFANLCEEHGLGDIVTIRSVSGGSIHQAFRIDTVRGSFFLKTNDGTDFRSMFEEEAKSLNTLALSGHIRIPNVLAVGTLCDRPYLLLEWILAGRPSKHCWEEFAERLFHLHQCTEDQFGWSTHNYIGTLDQINTSTNDWIAFLTEHRLEAQFKVAYARQLFTQDQYTVFTQFIDRLSLWIKPCKPALVHGDLWSGNYMIDSTGQVVLIDPACYFGQPEMDIGMARLFGGFSSTFFQSYSALAGWTKDRQASIDIHQLYFILVHVNLFGRSYVGQAMNVIRRYA